MPRNPTPKKTVSPVGDVPQPEPIDQETPAAVAVAEPPKPQPAAKKKKAATPKPPSDLLVEEVDREKRLAVAREQLLLRRRELLADGQDLSPDEFRLLKTAVPRSPTEDQAAWNVNWNRFLRREDSRIKRVLSLQASAGPPKDRTAADELAAKLAADRDNKGPAIREQIVALQGELDALHQSATDSANAADARHAAVENLRNKELLPNFVLDELNSLHHAHTRDFRRELQNLESRQISLQGLIELDPENQADHSNIKSFIGGNSRFGVDEIARLKHGFQFVAEQRPGGVAYRFGKLRPGVWESCVEELRTELASTSARIAEIVGGQQVDANREIDVLRRFYVPK